MIKYLDKEIIGGGEVKGFVFTQIDHTDDAYMYKVDDGDGNIHYEVFKRKNTPICIDFENHIYSDTEFKESYPKAKDFGIWAWTYSSFNKAIRKLLNYETQIRNSK